MIFNSACQPEMMSSLDFPSRWRSPRPEAAKDRTSAPTGSAKSRRRAAPWRPSLMSISEDVALFADGDATAKAAAGGGGGTRKASRAKSARSVRPRSFKDDYGYYRAAKLVPAFAPAAFVF
ncbi:hypothetical protein ZIOFF_034645 [Zingiber officinale]|uniref:Uncharacterized protein n=2 Tax=Zingiber officinale TaxID=94328 RepID=A0A8J5GQ02_ZINOF|nr:hypothetical protein ZIOFF_034645 [Zingiber officinale]